MTSLSIRSAALTLSVLVLPTLLVPALCLAAPGVRQPPIAFSLRCETSLEQADYDFDAGGDLISVDGVRADVLWRQTKDTNKPRFELRGPIQLSFDRVTGFYKKTADGVKSVGMCRPHRVN